MKNPLTLDAFADWLGKQPADQHYEYHCENCAIGGYLKSAGFPLKMIGTTTWSDHDGAVHDLPAGFDKIARTLPHTYGAAAQRARDAMADGSVLRR